MGFATFAVALSLQAAASVAAREGSQETLWGAVAFTASGLSAPGLNNGPAMLSPLGARQLHGAGAAFRARYISNDSNKTETLTRVHGLSPTTLNDREISILTTSNQPNPASAQAFMQGLYPPLELSRIGDSSFQSSSVDDIVVDFPLGNYQYPNIIALGPHDPASTELAGNVNCPLYDEARLTLLSDKDIRDLQIDAEAFYNDVYSRALVGIIDPEKLHVLNARLIWEHLNYQYSHNKTVHKLISPDEMMQARYFADYITFAMNSRPFRKRQFSRIQEQNFFNVGDVSTIAALNSISGASGDDQLFHGIPNHGASMIIELFSNISDGFPESTDDLKVRFFLRNGTNTADPNTEYFPYPIFNKTDTSYDEFISQIAGRSMSASEWCRFCSSKATFCPSFEIPKPDSQNRTKNDDPVIIVVITLLSIALILCMVFIVTDRIKTKLRKLQELGAQVLSGILRIVCLVDCRF
ncbi:predicted protein [Uncinocarpus reesii 1704]|uniref:Phosphoglycerate mutase-like protein n=1 Tax=Uncinocarpus reesii (strain UAMH 1704) TaxID=336963 RepID=C4JRW2_UNCRE|nr:uncharacterized protein UREG_05201 [Uncinocarpus reesii 1704]EEP80359.1 predicted protein [Uncinocarpus reesii 1704]